MIDQPATTADLSGGTYGSPAILMRSGIGPAPDLKSLDIACTATTLRKYAERKGWEVATIEVEVRYDVGLDLDLRRFIERTITVPVGLSEAQRARLADIAERTPVTLAIRNGTPIVTTFQTHND